MTNNERRPDGAGASRRATSEIGALSPRPNVPRRRLSDIPNFDEAFQRSFVAVAFEINRHLIDHMLRCSRELGLDFETLVIWGVLGHQNVAHLMPRGVLHSAYLDDAGLLIDAPAGLRPLRLRDIAQITRFPRESVRRKLAKLRGRRFVARERGGWVIVRDGIGTELRDFNRETAKRLIATAEEVLFALDQANANASSD